MAQPATPNEIKAFIARIAQTFPKRISDEELPEWLGSMVESFSVYPAELLNRAARRIIDTRKDSFFPLPSEVHKVCRELIEDDKRHDLAVIADHAPHLINRGHLTWTGDRLKLADDLLRTQIGKQAARDGWVLAFHDFCRNYQRAPTSNAVSGRGKAEADFLKATGSNDRSEIAFCKWTSKEFTKSYGQAVREAVATQNRADDASNRGAIALAHKLKGEVAMHKGLVALGDAMLKRRKELVQLALGEETTVAA